MCSNKLLDIKVITEPVEEPVSLEDCKAFMNVDYGEKDGIISTLIVAARQLLEAKYDIGIAGKTIQVILDNSCGGIELPGSPIGEVTGTNQDGGDLSITVIGDHIKYLECPASCYVKLVYTSGYSDITDVPLIMRTAIKQQVLWMFEHLGDEDMSDKVSPMAAASLKPYRRNGTGLFI